MSGAVAAFAPFGVFTAIKYVLNQSSWPCYARNARTGEETVLIQPGDGASINTWIEWCRSQQEFAAGHYISVRLFTRYGNRSEPTATMFG
jgi:hypothetical protein